MSAPAESEFRKARQRGFAAILAREVSRERIKIAEFLREEGSPIDIGEFDQLPETPGRIVPTRPESAAA